MLLFVRVLAQHGPPPASKEVVKNLPKITITEVRVTDCIAVIKLEGSGELKRAALQDVLSFLGYVPNCTVLYRAMLSRNLCRTVPCYPVFYTILSRNLYRAVP